MVVLLAGAASALDAQVMPPWLTTYPGATPQTKRTNTTVEATFTTAGSTMEVLSYYRKAFDAQGVPIDFIGAPEGVYLHAEPAECNVDIAILQADKQTSVKITCATKAGTVAHVSMEPVAGAADEDAEKKPAAGDAKPKAPVLTWPEWMTKVDGSKLAGHKVGSQFKGTYTTTSSRDEIERFYIELLDSNNFAASKSLPTGVEDSGNTIEGRSDPDPKTKHATVIQVKTRPSGQGFAVEITVE